MYWDISKPLSYNALFNFVVGNRGGGKTYGFKKYAIQKFLKTGKQFVYIRRYKDELKNCKKFFDDIAGEFPEIEFKVHNHVAYINGKEAGYFIVLSTAKIQKSTAFPDVETICYDEFILDKGTQHYLPDEVINFLECYETIARTRNNVKVFFLSNALTITNPYFLYFNIQLPYHKNISCKGDILIQLVQDSDYIKLKDSTRFGQLIKGTAYGDYAINNSFLRDNPTFIEKKTGNCVHMFKFIYSGTTYGVWCNMQAGKIYVSLDYVQDLKQTYALSKSDMTPNTMLIHSLKRSRPFKFFLDNYALGNVFYESMHIKNIVYEIVKLASIY